MISHTYFICEPITIQSLKYNKDDDDSDGDDDDNIDGDLYRPLTIYRYAHTLYNKKGIQPSYYWERFNTYLKVNMCLIEI